MTGVVVPKMNNNDASCTLLDWLYPDGGHVREGEPIALLETSKAAHELLAERSGILHHTREAGTECGVGEVIGHLFASEEDRLRHLAERSAAPADPGPLITDAARDLARRGGVSDEQLRLLGNPVVRSSDVEAIINGTGSTGTGQAAAPAPEGRQHLPTRGQRAVANVVSRSHLTIPAAFTAVRILTSAANQLRRESRWHDGGPPGIPELLTKAVATAVDSFPLFFATTGEHEDRVYLPDAAHVGVTIDVGTGLYVPVIKNAGRRTAKEIGELLADFRKRARTGGFQDDQLQGGNILVALHDYADVEFAVPMIYPGQVCALSVGGPQSELRLGPSGKVIRQDFFRLGVTYDHRLVNGRDAMLFAKEIKAVLEDPERIQALVS